MPIAQPNKHRQKTRETRDLLLRAAETVFVREGYAGAELGEIATLAGRTKGAIYAQFKSKEDIFLALVEEHTTRYRQEMQTALSNSTDVAGNRRAFRDFCLRLSGDRAWNLLMLEFKLFAIRNPQARQRLQEFFSRLVSPDGEARLVELLGPQQQGAEYVSLSAVVRLIHPLLSSLTLESMFDPGLLDPEMQQTVTRRLVDALLESCPAAHS